MQHDYEPAIRQRRLRIRGWVDIGIGGLLVLIGIGATLYTFFKVAFTGGTYIIAFGPVVAGFALAIRGVLRLLEAATIASHRRTPDVPEHRGEGVLALGFKSFIALRYLMVRHHRVSRIALGAAFLMLFVGISGLLLDHLLVTKSGPFDLESDAVQDTAKVITGVKIGGFVLFFIALVIGSLRYIFSFFTTVPLVGVWIGTGALVCVLSVMSGFESDLRTKILGSNAHIQITREDGEFTDWRSVKQKIDSIPGVVASTPYATSEVVLAANQNGQNVIIKGIDPKSVGKVTELVKDLEDPEAMQRLEPLIKDPHDLTVPQAPAKKSDKPEIDPPPADMPNGGDPIDFTQPQAGAPDDPPALQEDPVTDPPPPDLITTDKPPRDFSKAAGSGSDDPSFDVIDIPDDQPVLSRRTQALPGILVGRELVKQTHLYTGEEVRLVSPLSDPSNPDATGTPIPFNRDYRVAGIFFTGMYEYDLKYVYVTLDSFQQFLDRGDEIDGIEVRVDSPDDTGRYVHEISAALGPQYRVQDWQELNHSLFSALALEKFAMFVVLGIVILVASFSIVGNLIMVVVEKAREIALLKTLGASDSSVMLVFAIQGLLIGLIGTALGISTGLLACWAGKAFGIPLNPEVYYIDRMPIHVELGSVVSTALAGVLISLVATLYPAFVASRVRPATGLRH